MHYELIVFKDYPPSSDFLIKISAPINESRDLSGLVSKIDTYMNGGGDSINAIDEALSAAYHVLFIRSNLANLTNVDRHVILVTNSSPYLSPSKYYLPPLVTVSNNSSSTDDQMDLDFVQGYDANKQVEVLASRGVRFSIITPITIPEIIALFEKADLPSTPNPVQISKQGHQPRIVYLRGLKIFFTPPSADTKASPVSQINANNTSTSSGGGNPINIKGIRVAQTGIPVPGSSTAISPSNTSSFSSSVVVTNLNVNSNNNNSNNPNSGLSGMSLTPGGTATPNSTIGGQHN